MDKSIFRALAVVLGLAGVVLTPGRAMAIAVNDAGTHALLQTMIGHQQTQIANQQSIVDLLTQLVTSNAALQEAMGPATSVTTSAISGAFDLDAANIASTIPDLGFVNLPAGVSLPDLRSVDQSEKFIKDAFGLYTKTDRELRRTQRKLEDAIATVPGGDPKKFYVLIKDIAAQGAARRDALADTVGETMTTALYSLNQGADAQANENSLDLDRRSSSNLRGDMDTLHRSILELLSRTNHMILLLGQSNALDASRALQSVPLGDLNQELDSPPPNSGVPAFNIGEGQ